MTPSYTPTKGEIPCLLVLKLMAEQEPSPMTPLSQEPVRELCPSACQADARARRKVSEPQSLRMEVSPAVLSTPITGGFQQPPLAVMGEVPSISVPLHEATEITTMMQLPQPQLRSHLSSPVNTSPSAAHQGRGTSPQAYRWLRGEASSLPWFYQNCDSIACRLVPLPLPTHSLFS